MKNNIFCLLTLFFFITIFPTLGFSEINFNFVSLEKISDNLVITNVYVNNVVCYGTPSGSINIEVSGGTQPYTYAWSNGQSTQDISSLYAGNYYLTITDNTGVSITATYTVTEALAPIFVTNTKQNVTCFGGSNGSINLTVTGGVQPYTFEWSNTLTSEDISNLSAGSYTAIITDASGCAYTKSVNINQPAEISITPTITNIRCKGENNGSINLSVSGGITNYSYLWSNASTSKNQPNLVAGNYTVTVTDNFSCQKTQTFQVLEATFPLTAGTFDVTNVSCYGLSNGNISANIGGGVFPFSYLWSNGSTASYINNLPKGTYSVAVTDSYNCTISKTVEITEPQAALNVELSKTNPTCFNSSNGFIESAVSGGTAPYNFQWNNSLTTQNIQNLAAGFYSLTTTDANQCSVNDTITLYQPSTALVLTLNSTNVLCYGAATGHIESFVSGGIPAYNWLWSNGVTTQNNPNLAAGIYSVTVTDNNGCEKTSSIEIEQPINPISIFNIEKENVSCYGMNNGSITVNVGGGGLVYSLLWSNNSTQNSITNLMPADYTLFVTDINECEYDTTFTITQPSAPLSVATTVLPVDCRGNTTGSIELAISGGTPQYATLWSNGAATQNLNNSIAGKYLFTITDALGCSLNDSAIISEPLEELTFTAEIENAKCKSAANGSIELNVSGGTSPYTYLWVDGKTTQKIENLNTGFYTATATDSRGCTFTDTYFVEEPQFPIQFTNVITNNINCNLGNDGNISVNVAGGVPPYELLWSNNANTPTITNLTAGEYSLSVTDSWNCISQSTFTLTEPSTSLELTALATNVNCNNAGDGFVDLTVSGGTPPYEYLWSNGAVTQDISSLTPGNYSVTVTDANGCTAEITKTLFESMIVTAQIKPVSCYGLQDGGINVSVYGGTPTYNYHWISGENTEDLNNLLPAVYTITVSDAGGCVSTKNFEVTQPQYPLAQSYTLQNVKCKNDTTGIIDLTITGGTEPYSYIWSNNRFSQDLTNVAAGYYEVTIEDARDCKLDTFATITEPLTAMELDWTKTDILCFGQNNGAINITLQGGISPYLFLWSNGAISEDLTNIYAGEYSFTATDQNNCILKDTIRIDQPQTPIQFFVEKNNVTCNSANDGSISVTVSGGTPTYNYLWTNGGTDYYVNNLSPNNYTLEVTDFNNCIKDTTILIIEPFAIEFSFNMTAVSCYGENNGTVSATITGGTPDYEYLWSTNSIEPAIENCVAGLYSLQITDANECVSIENIEVTQPSAPIEVVFSTKNVSCKNGADAWAKATVTGGTQPFEYLWSNGETNSEIYNLAAGKYYVEITDSKACYYIDSVIITQPSFPLLSEAEITDVSCNNFNNGRIIVSVSGGIPQYTYLWSNGVTTPINDALSPGSYSLTITDASNCVITENYLIQQPLPLIANSSIETISCYGGNNGAINLEVSGGIAPYEFLWSTGENTQNIAELVAGTYSVIIKDENNCLLQYETLVTQAEELLLNFEVTNAICYGTPTGSIELTVTGGNPTYSYLWTNNAVTPTITTLTANEYGVTVTDNNNCTKSDTILLHQPNIINLNYAVSHIKCNGANDGAIVTEISGGTPPFYFEWSNEATSKNLYNLSGGEYSLIVTDNNGCQNNDTMFISEPFPITVSSEIYYSCYGANDGYVDVTVTGGVHPYNFLWNNDLITEDLQNLQEGTYSIVITDANNCSQSKTYFVDEPEEISLNETIIHPTCDIRNNGLIELNPTGGTPPYSYTWEGYDNINNSISDLYAGIYGFTVVDLHNCSISKSFQIENLYENCVEVFTAFSPNNDGFNDLWVIGNLESFPEAEVQIFDRYGTLVAHYYGYNESWDGTFNGEPLPIDTYYYFIDLNINFAPIIKGSVTLIR